MDQRVKEVQQWLNERYPSYFKYDPEGKNAGSFPVEPDGKTGNTTVKALIMALQINLGLSPVDGIWGNGTLNACPIISTATTNSDLVKIVQGGFICKGYNPGALDGIFGTSCISAVISYKKDLGFVNIAEVLAPYDFKFLLTTEPSKSTSKTDIRVREVQQFLNREYSKVFLSSLGYVSTGGQYDRLTARAIIFAFQSAIGAAADGVLGAESFGKMPSISVNNAEDKYIKLLRGMMICNGYSLTISLDGEYDEDLANQIKDFQVFMKLNEDPMVVLGKVNRRTWGALLWSKGDTDRKPNACDTNTRITSSAVAEDLYNRGYRYIGRYLTNRPGNSSDKKMTEEEITILLQSNLKIFPIFQETPLNVQPSFYTESEAVYAARRAMESAFTLGIPFDTTIYFAIDCDMTDSEIESYAIPFFFALKSEMSIMNLYKIGVYASRNICAKLKESHLVYNCFVSNMSWGFSANLGYKMPEDWAFEQFYEAKKISVGGITMNLDYNMASGQDDGFNIRMERTEYSKYIPIYIPTEEEMQNPEEGIVNILTLIPYIKELEELYYFYKDIDTPSNEEKLDCAKAVCGYLYQYKYSTTVWDFITQPDSDYIKFVKDNATITDDLYAHIFAKEEEKDGMTWTVRPKLARDMEKGLFEVPHLAVVIKGYMKSRAPGNWSAWAGDFATAVKEVYSINGNNVNNYINEEINRFGASEPIIADENQTRMFNYYDLCANVDGYKIAQMIQDMNIPLSEAIRQYYNDRQMYAQRYRFYQDCIEFEEWTLMSIAKTLVDYCNKNWVLMDIFASKAQLYPHSLEAAAFVFAMNILYWAKVQNVIE